MTKHNDDELLSHCHKAPIVTISADEGTAFWQCSECKQPCNVIADEDSKIHDFVGFGDDELRSRISDVMADLMVDVSLKKLNKNDGDLIEKGRLYIESHNGRLDLIMQLIKQRDEQVAREARRDELQRMAVASIWVGKALSFRARANEYISTRRIQLTTNHKGDSKDAK